jgi:hypothetical protein
MMNGGDDCADASEEAEGQHRQVLSQLRTIGKQKKAPVARTGSAVRGKKNLIFFKLPKMFNSKFGKRSF